MRAKPAAQNRSQEKHQRILTALDTLLVDRSFEDITITDIAAAAGVSPATIYQRFRNKDAAGAVLMELYFQRVQEWAASPRPQRERVPSAHLYDALKNIGRDACEQISASGHIMRPAYLYSRQHPDLAGKEWRRIEAVAVRGFRALLQRYADEVRLHDLDKAADTVCFLVNIIVAGKLLHAGTGGPHFLADKEAFATELADIVYRYLTPAGEA